MTDKLLDWARAVLVVIIILATFGMMFAGIASGQLYVSQLRATNQALQATVQALQTEVAR